MTAELRKEYARKFLEKFTNREQLEKTQEELLELHNAIIFDKLSMVLEEISDVLLMIEQLKIMYGISDADLDQAFQDKLPKIKKILGEV